MFVKKYYYHFIFLLALAVGVVAFSLFSFGFFNSWKNKLTDHLFLQEQSDNRIIIVAIDNKSLADLGRWPWDRKVHADLINKINQQKPAIIGIDVNFSDKSSNESDAELAKAIKAAGNVILPIEADLKLNKQEMVANSFLLPTQEIKEACFDLGVTNTTPDSDGILRRLPIFVYDNNKQIYYSFANKIARGFLDKKKSSISAIPIDNRGRMIINYFGKPGTFKIVSASDVVSGNIESELFKDKIILIGATAPDLHDEHFVPVSIGQPMSGVEVHANAIGTILNNNFLVPLKSWQQLFVFVLLSLLVAFIASYQKIIFGVIATFLIFIAYLIISFFLFDLGVIFDLFYSILIVFFTYLSVFILRYVTEEKEKRQIKNSFSRYVSPDVIKEILSSPDKLKLGGDKKELSILFSDIRGFTSMSEKLTPEQLVQLLNEYLSAMTDLIMSSDGVVDKYIGDAIMAFWGAPVKRLNHSELACKSALDMIFVLNQKKEEWKNKFEVELNIGIGINTGEVIIGNMGSDKRFDYTVMGDAVNLASRLEGVTKQYGVQIVISEFTKNKVGDKFIFRYLDKVAVKGKQTGIEIYELVQEAGEEVKKNEKFLSLFDQGISFYKKQKWDQALEVFSALLNQYPDDVPTKIYIERCRNLKDNPPVDWDGVYRLSEK